MTELLRAYEAAQELGMDPFEFVSYVHRREVPRTIVDGRPRFSLDDLLEKLKEDKQNEDTVYVFAQQYASAVESYGKSIVIEVATNLMHTLGRERTKELLKEDEKEQILRLQEYHRVEYFGALAEIVAAKGYRPFKDIKEFLPGRIRTTKKNLFHSRQAPVIDKEQLEEISARTGYNQRLVRGLIQEGYDVDYLDALVGNNFNLRSRRPLMGGSEFPRDLWRNNAIRSLETAGIQNDTRVFADHQRRLKNMELLKCWKGNAGVIALHPQWHSITKGYLREYLGLVMPAARNGKSDE